VGCWWPPSPALITGHCGVIGHQLRGAFPGVAQDDNIGVAADNPGHVRDAFAFGERCRFRVGYADDAAAEAVHRRFKREPGAGARLEENGCHYFTGAQSVLFRHFFGHFVRQGEYRFDFAVGQVVNGD
jgi:hypothetical protein